jgi:hypothetical protein
MDVYCLDLKNGKTNDLYEWRIIKYDTTGHESDYTKYPEPRTDAGYA